LEVLGLVMFFIKNATNELIEKMIPLLRTGTISRGREDVGIN
jgi:hypothetical protein